MLEAQLVIPLFPYWDHLNINIWVCGAFTVCVELMDSSGRVMNLEEKQRSAALTSSVLGERQHYVLLRVCRESIEVSTPHLVNDPLLRKELLQEHPNERKSWTRYSLLSPSHLKWWTSFLDKDLILIKK